MIHLNRALFNYMERMIRMIIREALGDIRHESGALTYTGDQLILFADNDSMTYNFAKSNPYDKMAIYKYAKARFERLHPNDFKEDEETVMYDFLAHYETPDETMNKDVTMNLFGPYYGSQAYFLDSVDSDTIKIKAKEYALEQRKGEIAKSGYGYDIMNGPDKDGYFTVILVKK